VCNVIFVKGIVVRGSKNAWTPIGAVQKLGDIFSVVLPGISLLSEPEFASSPGFLCLIFPGMILESGEKQIGRNFITTV
jgi:hypothetical protein